VDAVFDSSCCFVGLFSLSLVEQRTKKKESARGETKRGRERERERAYSLEEIKCLQCLAGMHCPLKHNKTRHKHMLLLFSAAVALLPNVKAPHATEALNSMQHTHMQL
jgi:hypothetical protein